MSEQTKSAELDLGKYEVPNDLTRLYDALQESSIRAFLSILAGETKIAKQWRLASRLCRQFLHATEEPALLALTSRLGDWDAARTEEQPPEEPHTFRLWLAVQAWRLLQVCADDERHYSHIDPIRHLAREGIIAAKTGPGFQRTYAQRVANGESKIEERERGPRLEKAGRSPGLRLVREETDVSE